MVEVLGTRKEAPAVYYTVNPAVGFPNATGPEGSANPVSQDKRPHLPYWQQNDIDASLAKDSTCGCGDWPAGILTRF